MLFETNDDFTVIMDADRSIISSKMVISKNMRWYGWGNMTASQVERISV